MNNKYSIVWQMFSPGSDIALRFRVSEFEGALPFLVDGENLILLESGKKIPLDENMLLKGILLGFTDSGLFVNTDDNRKLLLSLLPFLVDGFNCVSVEKMILDYSCYLREHFSNYSAYICLKNGLLIDPESSKIKCDFVSTIFDIWKEDPDIGYDYMVDVIENFYKINMLDILPQAIEMCVYTTFVSVYFKSPDNIFNFLENYCYKYINSRVLKDKIKYLLDNKDSLLKDAFY